MLITVDEVRQMKMLKLREFLRKNYVKAQIAMIEAAKKRIGWIE